MTKYQRFIPLLFCILLPLSSQAAPWYRVEMMLIAYESASDIDQELWSDALPAAVDDGEEIHRPDFQWWQAPAMYRQMHSALWAGFGFEQIPQSTLPAPFTPLENLRLAEEATRIDKRKGMKVVWHQAWIEPVQEEGQAIKHPLNLRTEDEIDIEITGSFELHRSRYLHISTDLTVQHYQLKGNEALRQLQLPESDSRSDFRPQLMAAANIEASLTEEDMPVPLRAAEVKQTRRMRSGELHYLDHPMLGVVIKVIPIESAEDL